MIPFAPNVALEDAWLFLKRVGAGQYELGDFDLDFPHTKGPIVRLHGKHETPEGTARINQEGIKPFVDYNDLDERGRPHGWQGQKGADSAYQDGTQDRNAPLYTSVTRDRRTAEDYARGESNASNTWMDDISNLRGFEEKRKAGNRTPTMYGVRLAALARRQALDDPNRDVQHHTQNPGSTYRGGRGEFEHIRDGIERDELHRFKNTFEPAILREQDERDPRFKDTKAAVFDEFNTWNEKAGSSSPDARQNRVRGEALDAGMKNNADMQHHVANTLEAQEQQMWDTYRQQEAVRQAVAQRAQERAAPQAGSTRVQSSLSQFQ